MAISKSYPGPGSDKRVRALYSNIHGLYDNLDELAVAGSDYDVLVCADSKVSDQRHLSESIIPGVGCPQEAVELHTWSLFMLGKDSAPSDRASWSVLAMSLVCFVSTV